MLDPIREAHWLADRNACLDAFLFAVREAKRRNYVPGLALIERVRVRGGDAMAAIASAELRRHVTLVGAS